jgi:hypothetical protein
MIRVPPLFAASTVAREGAAREGWIDESSEQEAVVLPAWDGRGAVRLPASPEESGAALRQWLDPDGTLATVPADAAAEIAGLLPRRLRIIVGAADLDLEVARRWAVVRLVDCWLWGLRGGFTQVPIRCRTLIDWLAPISPPYRYFDASPTAAGPVQVS